MILSRVFGNSIIVNIYAVASFFIGCSNVYMFFEEDNFIVKSYPQKSNEALTAYIFMHMGISYIYNPIFSQNKILLFWHLK